MSTNNLNNNQLSVEEACHCILDSISILEPETVPIVDACDRVCAEDVKSDIDVIPFDNAAMDGFAVRVEDLKDADSSNKISCKVIAEVGAGDFYDGIAKQGEVIRIMTGAAVPDCMDAVVKYEDVDYLDGDGMAGSTVSFSECPKIYNNIRRAGEDVRCGEVVIKRGEVIKPGGVGFLANCGIEKVSVYRKPKVAIISIGSELSELGKKLDKGCIYESNSYAMQANVKRAGGLCDIYPIVKDDLDKLVNTIKDASKKSDFIITTGGASNGDFDFIKPAIQSLGEMKFSIVNMRPGKCQAFGIINKTPIMGLPGNPAAAYCGFEILVRPALLKMQGRSEIFLKKVEAVLDQDLKKRDSRRLYFRGILKRDNNGTLTVSSAGSQSSGLYGPLQASNCLGIVMEGKTEGFIKKGTVLKCIPFGVSEEAVI